ncbi:MAG: family transcriptional regulator [Hyphomicrobiales bacterium]|nr:family transcriptional regulator [Hyphomicrobiales bacterium]
MTGHENYLVRKISTFVDLSVHELKYLSDLQSSPIRVKKGREIVHEGQAGQSAYIIHEGWACSFKLLPDGGRQIITFPIPGDCVGLRSILLRTSDHSFSALTDSLVSRIQAARMKDLFNELPRLGAAILWAASRDEAMVVEHLVSIGRRNAMERTAHFLLELNDRLQLVGLASNHSFACPLNQYVLADALGLSTIHVNRVLRLLRERGLVTLKNQMVVIQDMAGMKALAGYVNRDDDEQIEQ